MPRPCKSFPTFEYQVRVQYLRLFQVRMPETKHAARTLRDLFRDKVNVVDAARAIGAEYDMEVTS